MHPNLIQKILRDSTQFGQCSDEEITALADRMFVNRRTLGKLEVAIHAGDDDNNCRMFIVLEGALKVVLSHENGERETVLNVLSSGSIFGELAMLDGGSRSASVIAIMPSIVASLHQREFYALCEKHSQVLIQTVRFLCGEVRRLSRRFDQVTSMGLPQRLAAYLLELGQTFGHQPIRITQLDLSGAVGATREQVSRQMKSFYSAGYLTKIDGASAPPTDGGKVGGRHAQFHITPHGIVAFSKMIESA